MADVIETDAAVVDTSTLRKDVRDDHIRHTSTRHSKNYQQLLTGVGICAADEVIFRSSAHGARGCYVGNYRPGAPATPQGQVGTCNT